MIPFVYSAIPPGTHGLLCDSIERILGHVPRSLALDTATHLLAQESCAERLPRLWGMHVLASEEVRSDEMIVAGSYQGIERGPIDNPDALLRFRPVAIFMVSWGQPGRPGVVIHGVDVPRF
jgi:hypothetical protein